MDGYDLLPMEGYVDENTVRDMIYNCPDQSDLDNWIGVDVVKQFMDSYGDEPFEMYTRIWVDFYTDHTKLWFDKMIDLGYDAAMVDQGNGHIFFIVYNESIINVKKVLFADR